jgi:outer membrane protein assembly factor BamB
MGSRGGGSFAIRATGDSDDRTVWSGRDGANISSPVYWEGHLYWIEGSLANCRNAGTGEEVYSERIPGTETGGQGSGGGDRNARFAGMDYSSPVAAGGYLYQITRNGDGLVVKLGSKFELVARNKFASDSGDFSATPAISDGQLFIRSSKNLYCVAE